MQRQQVTLWEPGLPPSAIQIDVIASNNDGMGMSMFNAWSKDNQVPTFGYDANSDAWQPSQKATADHQPACGRTGLSDTPCSS